MNKTFISIGLLQLALFSCASLRSNSLNPREPAKEAEYSLTSEEGGQELHGLLLQTSPKVSVIEGYIEVNSITCAGGIDLKPALCTMRGGNNNTGEGNAELREPYAGTFMKRLNRIKHLAFPKKNIYDLQVTRITCDELGICSITILPTSNK